MARRLTGAHEHRPGDPVISVVVVPARIVPEYRTDIPDWDLADASPDNGLFKIMSETWPG